MFDVIDWIKHARRVMNVATRPRQKEFEKIVKTTGLGIILIGLIGVIISAILSQI